MVDDGNGGVRVGCGKEEEDNEKIKKKNQKPRLTLFKQASGI